MASSVKKVFCFSNTLFIRLVVLSVVIILVSKLSLLFSILLMCLYYGNKIVIVLHSFTTIEI